jgi:hypothetical protein
VVFMLFLLLLHLWCNFYTLCHLLEALISSSGLSDWMNLSLCKWKNGFCIGGGPGWWTSCAKLVQMESSRQMICCTSSLLLGM